MGGLGLIKRFNGFPMFGILEGNRFHGEDDEVGGLDVDKGAYKLSVLLEAALLLIVIEEHQAVGVLHPRHQLANGLACLRGRSFL